MHYALENFKNTQSYTFINFEKLPDHRVIRLSRFYKLFGKLLFELKKKVY